MNNEDIYYYQLDEKIDNEIDKNIKQKSNRVLIKKFDGESKLQEKTIATTATNKQKLFYFFKNFIKKDWTNITREDMEVVITKINSKSDWTEKSKSNYKKIIKQFDKWYNGGEVCSGRTSWISASPKKRKLNTLQKSDLLTVAEKKKLINSTDCKRDKALISLWLETGMRPKELRTLTVGSLTFDRDIAYVNVMQDNKTGQRPVPVYFSKKSLLEYINEHPAKEDKNAPLWINQRKNKILPINKKGFEAVLQKVVLRSGINKRVYWYLGRHNSYTDKSAEGWNEQITKQFHGIEQSSTVLDRYVHLSGVDVANKVRQYYGLEKTKKTAPDLTLIKCINCNAVNENTNVRCKKCGYIIDPIEMNKQLQKKETEEKETEKRNMFIDWLMSEVAKAGKVDNFRDFAVDLIYRKGKGKELKKIAKS